MVVDGVDEVVVVMVVDEERGSSSSRSLEELSSLNVDRLLLANTKCLMARMTAVALYACCKIFFQKIIRSITLISITFHLLMTVMIL